MFFFVKKKLNQTQNNIKNKTKNQKWNVKTQILIRVDGGGIFVYKQAPHNTITV